MKAETGFGIAVIGIWVMYLILWVVGSAAAIYAVLHFIKKFW